uniref:bifunctional adenosylcobinamide kinase/adenosylcobinamide-phosphate guanylyltransferase n=1 Tax=Clostridium sp. NkU-1 TaxID=1095009 RepID=UPI0006D17CEA
MPKSWEGKRKYPAGMPLCLKSVGGKEDSMILIIGGAWQGKLAFAMELAKSAGKMAETEGKTSFNPLPVSSVPRFTGHQLDMQEYPLDSSVGKSEKSEEYEIAEGSRDSFEAAMTCRLIHGLHEYIRRLLKEGKSVDAFLEAVQQQNPHVIITSNELGCGIVPLDPEDREWREVSGRASVRLARNSKEVYRMVCGIGTRIK